jgi:hypothetical protein
MECLGLYQETLSLICTAKFKSEVDLSLLLPSSSVENMRMAWLGSNTSADVREVWHRTNSANKLHPVRQAKAKAKAKIKANIKAEATTKRARKMAKTKDKGKGQKQGQGQRQDKTRQDKARQDKTRQDKTRQDSTF